ncbi:MAG: hypothetical protein JW771_01905 [Candidatus Thermoplasmatota archaeon]|nr:hypothetical protein [Candidatus Thermoplasmatota archaeon]
MFLLPFVGWRWNVPAVKRSDVVKNILTTLLRVSGRKTNQGHAISTLESLIKQLESKYEFLKHIQITDTRFLEGDDPVSVMTDIDKIAPVETGKAIQDIISTMHSSLGMSAGHFFIKELQTTLKDDDVSSMKRMGVDLSLMQLEREVNDWRRLATEKK